MEQEQRTPALPARWLPCAAAFVCAFLLVILLFHTAFTLVEKNFFPTDKLLAKLQWLTANPEKYDTLFIGSSYVENHIAISEFDKKMAANGIPTRSFSLSADSLSQFHEFIVLRMLKKDPRIRPKYIFIEPSLDWRAETKNKQNANAERFRILHTTQNTWDGCILDFLSNASLLDKINLCGTRLGFCLSRLTTTGRAASLQKRINKNNKDMESLLGKERNGYLPISSDYRWRIPIREKFLKEIAPRYSYFVQRANDFKEGKDPQGLQEETFLVRMIINEIRSMGVEPVIFIAPGLKKYHFPVKTLASPDDPQKVAAFDFFNPAAYPSLYKLECYWNEGHLYSACAEEFSRQVANRFSTYLKSKQKI